MAGDRVALRDPEVYLVPRRKELGGRRENRYQKRITVEDELRLLRRALDTRRPGVTLSPPTPTRP